MGVLPILTRGDYNQLIVFLSVYTCVLLHEYGHAITAKKLGYPCSKISLHLFGGVASITKEMRDPRHEFWIAINGPVVNMVLAALFMPFIQYELINILYIVNIALMIFNLIPIFPMDGGRIFRATLGLITSKDYRFRTKIAYRCSCIFIPIMACVFAYIGSIMGVIIMALVWIMGNTEYKASMKYVPPKKLPREVRS